MRFFVKRPVLSSLFFASILLLGVYSIKNTPVELVPEEKLPSLTIQCYWRGASPEAILEKIGLPIEEQVSQMKWVRKVRTYCGENMVRVKVEFEEKANMDLVYVMLKERLNRLKDKLPRQASRPTIIPFVPKEFKKKPFLSFAIYGNYSVHTLRQIAEREFAPALRAIPGVQQIRLWGGAEPQLEVVLRPEMLSFYRVGPGNVYLALRNSFYNLPSINIRKEGKEISLLLSRWAGSLAELENVVVLDRAGKPVRLKDIALVRQGYAKVRQEKRYMGMPIVTIDVFKEPEASSMKLSKLLKQKIEQVEAKLAGRVKTRIIEDESRELSRRLMKLLRLSLLILAVIFMVLFVVVRDLRASLLVFSSVAFSVFATFTVIYLLKIPLNLLTLSGLALGFGMFVDNAVVVFENILRLREEGLSADEAAVKGAEEVILPVVASTITTTVVFFSFAYFQGRLRLYYLPLAKVIAIALISSVVVAFTLIPSLSARLRLRARRPPAERRGRLIGWAFRYPAFFVIPFALCLFFSYKFFREKVPLGYFISWYQKQHLMVYIRLPEGSDFQDTKRTILQFEKIVLEKPYPKEVKTQIIEETAYMDVTFPPEIEFSPHPYILKQELIGLATNMAGIGVSVYGFDPKGYYYSPSVSSFLPYSITLKGYDFQRLKEIALQLKRQLLRHPRIPEVEVATERTYYVKKGRYYRLKLDYAALRDYDIKPSYLLYLLSGLVSESSGWMRLVYQGREMPVEVKLQGAGSLEMDELLSRQFISPSGKPFRLKDVVVVEEGTLKGGIERENQEFMCIVMWDYLGSYKRGKALRKTVYKNLVLPPGFRKEEERPFFFIREEEKAQLKFAIAVSLLLIYLVLGMLYESFLQPVLIMVSIPLALLGVFLAFLIANLLGVYPFDSTAYIGIILLSGIVVNNSIILVDHINSYRNKGLSLDEAVVRGTLERVRPVLITAFTTVAGMLPLVVFHKGGQTDIWTSLALCGVGGLTSSALLIFLILPGLYPLLVKAENYFKKLLSGRRKQHG